MRNAPLHPFLRLIYFFLRVTAWVCVGFFYRRRLVLGRPNAHFDGPAIVIANHPSTLLDVLNAGLPIHQEMFFLANYGLFKNPVSGWLLRRLFCIPVMRRSDVAEGEVRSNDAAFEQSFQHLEKGGVLFIAPEGESWMWRAVREFKTGTARIALGAEARNGGQLGVKIVPIGMTYSAADRFRSEVVVQIGEPLLVSRWLAEHREIAADPEMAVDALTAELEARTRALTIHTGDEAGDHFIARLEELSAHEAPVSQEAAFRRGQQLAEQHLHDAGLRDQVETYFSTLKALKISDLGVSAFLKNGFLKKAGEALFLLLGLPFFLIGYGFWFLPCYAGEWAARRLDLYIGYDSTLKVVVGLFTFPAALWLAGGIAHHFLMYYGWIWAWGVLLILIALGFFAEQYRDVFRRFSARIRAGSAARQNREAWNNLLRAREQLRAAIS